MNESGRGVFTSLRNEWASRVFMTNVRTYGWGPKKESVALWFSLLRDNSGLRSLCVGQRRNAFYPKHLHRRIKQLDSQRAHFEWHVPLTVRNESTSWTQREGVIYKWHSVVAKGGSGLLSLSPLQDFPSGSAAAAAAERAEDLHGSAMASFCAAHTSVHRQMPHYWQCECVCVCTW